ncbi:MAG: 16S rRNA (cytosine(1402)-N(4))-methyltransferase RsmH [Endomicrobia bacterium]|nr:16S rRNA (cytosine(1402)-N(4))-methyltransferase RsmH [Endomicrobiia bacterium]MCX7940430.1 16S rRNA (cytosine(1402)-N(4))-methyltransferase RsmH [Endomicrobiia bacterium]MDW8055877.1 16S rRNA (cytosine(1402)-N(4))-methyltransferase RsmH [Elusimicrobiota bacterium]
MHIPVLIDEIIKFIQPKQTKVYLDATLGCGGYTEKILTICPACIVIGIDWDQQAIDFSKERLKKYIESGNLIVIKDNYQNVKHILKSLRIYTVDGAMMDLGMSTLQLKSSRGFSFNDDNLDMRMDPSTLTYTAEFIVNNFSEEELVKIFCTLGEEKHSKFIAKKIVEYRKNKKIEAAKELTQIVQSVLKPQYKRLKINNLQQSFKFNPATRIFQALRIFVNNELNNLQQGLNNIIDVLCSKGRIAVTTYHSLEDRIVKNIFKERKDVTVLTKKPIIPSQQEIKNNLSARSAKLRVGEKL